MTKDIETIMALQTIEEVRDLGDMLQSVVKVIAFGTADQRCDADLFTGVGSTLCFASAFVLELKDDLRKRMSTLFRDDDEDSLDDVATKLCGLGELFVCAATGEWEKLDPVPFMMLERYAHDIASEVCRQATVLKNSLSERGATN
jgi:hypothetical protein